MGVVFSQLSSVAGAGRMRAATVNDLWADNSPYWSVGPWISQLSAAGVYVTPELAMTLSAMHSGVRMISNDLATCAPHMLKYREDGGKDRVPPLYGRGIDSANGIRSLAYMLRWQPNPIQTAAEFWVSMIAQYLLRDVAYAEIVTDARGFVVSLAPRHPDRVVPERVSSGRLRYKLLDPKGPTRYLVQEELFVVRGMSHDMGLTTESRVKYGAEALGSALATQRAAGKFFKSGMTAAKVASYKGGSYGGDEWEERLHKSISRYASGVDNSFGLALIPDDVTITNLGVEPEKAQMMEAQEWGVREVARVLNMPGSKLGIKDSVSYNSQVQSALDYVITCLRPIAVVFEQAIKRDLIDVKDAYTAEFNLDALLRGDPAATAAYLKSLGEGRYIWPSEGRIVLNMNPDPELDELWKRDHQPGTAGGAAKTDAPDGAPDEDAADDEAETDADESNASASRTSLRALLLVYGQATHCVKRECVRVAEIAKKHASDPSTWKAAVDEFYVEHAGYVAKTMRLSSATARTFTERHRADVEARGIAVFDDAWAQLEAETLTALALEPHGMAA